MVAEPTPLVNTTELPEEHDPTTGYVGAVLLGLFNGPENVMHCGLVVPVAVLPLESSAVIVSGKETPAVGVGVDSVKLAALPESMTTFVETGLGLSPLVVALSL
jgi:hypothetical protein